MARRLSKSDIISNIYYDPAEGFGSVKDILERAKEEDPTITTKDFLKKQPNKQIRKHRGHNSYAAPFCSFSISDRHTIVGPFVITSYN